MFYVLSLYSQFVIHMEPKVIWNLLGAKAEYMLNCNWPTQSKYRYIRINNNKSINLRHEKDNQYAAL